MWCSYLARNSPYRINIKAFLSHFSWRRKTSQNCYILVEGWCRWSSGGKPVKSQISAISIKKSFNPVLNSAISSSQTVYITRSLKATKFIRRYRKKWQVLLKSRFEYGSLVLFGNPFFVRNFSIKLLHQLMKRNQPRFITLWWESYAIFKIGSNHTTSYSKHESVFVCDIFRQMLTPQLLLSLVSVKPHLPNSLWTSSRSEVFISNLQNQFLKKWFQNSDIQN